MKPLPGSYPSYFANYIKLVSQSDVNLALSETWTEVQSYLSTLPESMGDYRYAPEKWSIKQVLNHVSDTERIFTYRALRFARHDAQMLPSFNENDFAKHAEVMNRTLIDLLEEWYFVRQSAISLFQSFSEPTLQLTGQTASGEVSVLALGFMIAGHPLHHLNVLRERYLKSV